MKVILFDGVCNLCNGSVNWVIDRDRENVFKFASLQSEFAISRLGTLGYDGETMDSIVLDDEGIIFTESDAVLRILKYIGGVYSFSTIFILIPRSIRNKVYRFIANHRYSWFGKQETCRVPTPELKEKFL